MKKKKHAEDQLDLDARFGTAAFPDSPSGGGTMRGANGLTTQGNRDRGRSGHFPIPRFDSIRGRFDSGIFASNTTGQTNGSTAVNHTGTAGGGAGSGQMMMHLSGEDLGKVTAEQAAVPTTALSTPSGTGTGSGSNGGGGGGESGSGSYKAPRSTVLGVSGTTGGKGSGGGGGGGGGTAGQNGAAWGLAMSGEYPDVEGSADPYAVDNAMAETGTGAAARSSHM